MTGTPVAERVVQAGNPLGETPVWCQRTQTLYWINCEPDPALFHWDPATGAMRRWPMPRRIGAVAIRDDGGLIVALADGVYAFDTGSGTLDLIAAGPHGSAVVLHEGRCDRRGRFWVGSCQRGVPGSAFFYRLDGDRLVPQIGGFSICNSLAFSPDDRTLYCGDSIANRVWAHDYDIETGAVANRRIFIELDPAEGLVDGAAVDAAGGYWIALFRGGVVRRYLPDGTLDRVIALPVTQPTMPAFGGPRWDRMFVTSTRHGKGPEEIAAQPALGDIFCIDGVGPGLPDPLFRRG